MSRPRAGHVKISRKAYADDPWWNERREFSKWEAWEDVIQMAAFRASKRVTASGDVVELARGEFVASLRFLADRWGWGVKQVRGFVAIAGRMGRFRAQRETPLGTVYVVVNYDVYQSEGTSVDTAQGTARAQEGHSEGTKEKQLSRKAEEQKTDDLRVRVADAVGEPLLADLLAPLAPDVQPLWVAELAAALRGDADSPSPRPAAPPAALRQAVADYVGNPERERNLGRLRGYVRRAVSALAAKPPGVAFGGGGAGDVDAEALFARLEAAGLTVPHEHADYHARIAAAANGEGVEAFRAVVVGVRAWELSREGERRFGVKALRERLAALRATQAGKQPAGAAA